MARQKSITQRMNSLNKWREQYNPLRGLTISRAVSWLEAAQRGEFADVQWACFFVEQTDPDLLALIERRSGAVLEMDWDIRIVSKEKAGKKFDQKLAEDQAAALRLAYETIDNLYEAIEHQEMAVFRGFAHCQKWFGNDGAIQHLEPLDQWNWVRAGMYGQWYYNPDAQSVGASAFGPQDAIEPSEYLIRIVRRPVNRIGLLKFIRSNLSQKDWDSFVEIYGVPGGVVIGPANVQPEKEATYRDAAEDVAEGASGYLPNGCDIKWPDTVRGSSPFREHMRWLQEQLILAGTGGLLTMLTEAGSGTLAGGAHADTFRTIARSDARKVSELFQTQLDKATLDVLFPGKPRLAYFQLAAQEEQNVGEIVEHAFKLRQAGFQMDQAQLQEKTGYTLALAPVPAQPGAGEELPPALRITQRRERSNPPAASRLLNDDRTVPMDTLDQAAKDDVCRAQATDLAKLRDRLEVVLSIDDDTQLKRALENLERDLPGYLIEMNRNPAAAKAMEDSLTAAFINGWIGAALERRIS